MPISAETVESLRAKFDTILPHLDERATRLLLAAEPRSLGHGGITAVGRASGAALSRIQRGVNELEAGTAPRPGIRKPGAGRKTLETQGRFNARKPGVTMNREEPFHPDAFCAAAGDGDALLRRFLLPPNMRRPDSHCSLPVEILWHGLVLHRFAKASRAA